MTNLRNFILIGIIMLTKHAVADDIFECECDCTYLQQTPQCPREAREPFKVRKEWNFIPACFYYGDSGKSDYDFLNYCNGRDTYQSCQGFGECCWLNKISNNPKTWRLQCNVGPNGWCSESRDVGGNNCFTATDCHCNVTYFSDYSFSKSSESTTPVPPNDKSQTDYLAIGIGVGIGICVFIALHVALLLYCRLRGRREGQNNPQEFNLPTTARVNNKRRGDDGEYAEIDSYVGDDTMRAVANQTYNSSDTILTLDQSNKAYTSLNAPYKSLKKPNHDLGDGDYADPEKYTEPPVLPKRNSNVIDEEDDDEDYVSQGIPEPAKENERIKPLPNTSRDYVSVDSPAQPSPIEPTAPSSDYVSVDSPDQPSPIEPTAPSSDYVSVDSPDRPSPIAPTAPSNDYVSVDSPDQPGPIEPTAPSNDYVSVDSPDQPGPIEPTAPSNDYVSVDSPDQPSALETTAPSSDYVSVDSPDQPSPIEPTAPSSDYVSVDGPDQPSPIEPTAPSSDYVSVDSPDRPSPIEPMAPSSDYVSVDSPDQPSPIEPTAPSSDYVSADSPDQPSTNDL